MSIETVKAALPDYAKDLRLNLSNLAAEPVLNDTQKAGCFIACAIAAREPMVIAAIMAEFAPKMSAEALNGAKAAAAIMAMNNIYYRFTYLTKNEEYGKLPAKLRMNVIATSGGASKADFELWALAVSTINGCGMCIDSHEKVLKEHGLTTEQVQAAAKIAAVVFATAVTIEAEKTLATPLSSAA